MPVVSADHTLFSLDELSYDKATKTLVGSWRSYPSEVRVISPTTGTIVAFKPIKEGHPQFCHDFWDGEMAKYEPTSPNDRVSILILTASQS